MGVGADGQGSHPGLEELSDRSTPGGTGETQGKNTVAWSDPGQQRSGESGAVARGDPAHGGKGCGTSPELAAAEAMRGLGAGAENKILVSASQSRGVGEKATHVRAGKEAGTPEPNVHTCVPSPAGRVSWAHSVLTTAPQRAGASSLGVKAKGTCSGAPSKGRAPDSTRSPSSRSVLCLPHPHLP